MAQKQATGDKSLRSAIWSVAGTTVVLSLGSLGFADLRFAFGVFIGGAIAVSNLLVLARIVEAFLGGKGNTAPWAIIAVLKLVLLLGGVYLILKSNVVPALSIVVGYLSLPVGAVIGSLFGAKPPEEPTPPEGPTPPEEP